MAIIRSRPVATRQGGQRGGANLNRVGPAYEASMLRQVMEPALTAFGQSAGQALGSKLAGGAASGLGGLLANQDVRPSDMVAAANSTMNSLLQRYGSKKDAAGNPIFNNINDLRNMEKLRAAGVSDDDMNMAAQALSMYDQGVVRGHREMFDRVNPE